MKYQSILFYSRCLLTILAITGTVLEIMRYGVGMLMYYTVQSNLLVSIFAVYMLYAMRKDIDLQNHKFLRIKAAVTMSIMITCVVYHFMLAPLAKDFWRVENMLCHYIVPLYFLLDTLIVDRQRQYKWFDPIWWTTLPVFYMIFGLVNGFFIKIPIPDAKDSPFAYFFLNVPKYGWPYVLTYAGTIFVAYLLCGFLLVAIKSLNLQRPVSIKSDTQ
ncbi:Pr6Pr family membrane protein [Streptococcus ruminantium]|uniref:Pr6Pr family membrane protein n=1 Tax=Streptococcus ruminantium TaxID=1917441 RepID=A0ABU1B0K2_9STRE|nr:Pr6Pr family membrane protein [Streptococcus ruminantium]MDQ8758483.1 Pr6Pr family membrane protein [Streptococcus ruminantium]MDQ8764614.1 Pr6Pr family membrane protein [Streptococcus ruminantium]MDQ8766259.1 Pr6Pr family membrane protein [Streptococcus ruminantium]MDQ8768155.1 Pr6Pr family membrane protein [Streptococcus ruminantium]MDQ8773948.1 Pr6Pr family membrane protein [Streptococcus ruminantium]